MNDARNGTGTRELSDPDALTIVCVCTGVKYKQEYVYKLREAVTRHLSHAFIFMCITDQKELLEDTHLFTVTPVNNYGGWWNKINLFDAAHYPQGTSRVMYIDLDCVITGDLDPIAERSEPLVMISNYGPNWRHSPVNSSVMVFDPYNDRVQKIAQDFEVDPRATMKALHGDQCFIWRSYGAENIARFADHECISYKYHCRGKNLPMDAKVVVFHGKPDPEEVKDAWVKTLWGDL